MNVLIQEIASSHPPDDYHSYENNLASLYSEVKNGRYKIDPSSKLWINTSTNSPVSIDTLGHMIEQGSSNHYDVLNLVLAAAGRVAGAMKNKKSHFDNQDSGHMEMLAVVMTTILFRRSDKLAK